MFSKDKNERLLRAPKQTTRQIPRPFPTAKMISESVKSQDQQGQDRAQDQATTRVDSTTTSHDKSNSVASVTQGQIVLLAHAMDELPEQVLRDCFAPKGQLNNKIKEKVFSEFVKLDPTVQKKCYHESLLELHHTAQNLIKDVEKIETQEKLLSSNENLEKPEQQNVEQKTKRELQQKILLYKKEIQTIHKVLRDSKREEDLEAKDVKVSSLSSFWLDKLVALYQPFPRTEVETAIRFYLSQHYPEYKRFDAAIEVFAFDLFEQCSPSLQKTALQRALQLSHSFYMELSHRIQTPNKDISLILESLPRDVKLKRQLEVAMENCCPDEQRKT